MAVARDNAAPYLDAAEVKALLAATLAYLAREQDVRGCDASKGWMHSAAHTADLVKFLARSRHYLLASAQREILDAIGEKVRNAPGRLHVRRRPRVARAVLSIVNRDDFDREVFDAWVGRVTPVWPKTPRPEAAVVRVNQNSVESAREAVHRAGVARAAERRRARGAGTRRRRGQEAVLSRRTSCRCAGEARLGEPRLAAGDGGKRRGVIVSARARRGGGRWRGGR